MKFLNHKIKLNERKSLIIFILLFGIFNYSFDALNSKSNLSKIEIEDTDTTLILWSSTNKLKWEDFQGTPDEQSIYKALTFVRIQIKPLVLSDSACSYDIRCLFEKQLSWSKSMVSENLLRHEQLHFDIVELCIRKLRKDFSNSNSRNSDKVHEYMVSLFNKAKKERRMLNNFMIKKQLTEQ